MIADGFRLISAQSRMKPRYSASLTPPSSTNLGRNTSQNVAGQDHINDPGRAAGVWIRSKKDTSNPTSAAKLGSILITSGSPPNDRIASPSARTIGAKLGTSGAKPIETYPR